MNAIPDKFNNCPVRANGGNNDERILRRNYVGCRGCA